MEYTQGVLMDGAAILCDGEMITIDEIVQRLNENADIRAQLEASEFHRSNNLIEISELCAKLAEARKDSERLDWLLNRDNTGFSSLPEYDENYDEVENDSKFKVLDLYWIDGRKIIGRGETKREAIDNAMKGGE